MYSRSLSALAFVADFPSAAPKFHQRTHRVRLRNLGTTDKKSSHKIRHRKIPRVHYDAKEEEHEEQNNEKGIGYRDVSGFACILTGSSQCTGGCLETEQNRLVVAGG